jgi:hypothetical protein
MTSAPPKKHLAGYGALAGISAALATALWVGGSPTAPPPSIQTPVASTYLEPGMVGQTFTWTKSEGATGYRMYIDGVIVSQVPGSWTAALFAVKCGVKHRFNAQPYNNKGLAPLAAPVYVTPPCDKATK